jgi:hypothetical protein
MATGLKILVRDILPVSPDQSHGPDLPDALESALPLFLGLSRQPGYGEAVVVDEFQMLVAFPYRQLIARPDLFNARRAGWFSAF